MSIIRMLFWGLLFYFGYKVVQQVFVKNDREPEVKGTPKQDKIDIDESQIEDADFEELDDE